MISIYRWSERKGLMSDIACFPSDIPPNGKSSDSGKDDLLCRLSNKMPCISHMYNTEYRKYGNPMG